MFHVTMFLIVRLYLLLVMILSPIGGIAQYRLPCNSSGTSITAYKANSVTNVGGNTVVEDWHCGKDGLKNGGGNDWWSYSDHTGTDFFQAKGSPIYAAASGKVMKVHDSCPIDECDKTDAVCPFPVCCPGVTCMTEADKKCVSTMKDECYLSSKCKGCGSAGGNHIIIYDEFGRKTTYLHMQYGSIVDAGITVGKLVTAGTVIGKVASSGQSTGHHLHFETKEEGWI